MTAGTHRAAGRPSIADVADGRWQPLRAAGGRRGSDVSPGTGAEAGWAADGDTGSAWLRYAIMALAVLAAAAAVVSWDAQYVLVHAVKRAPAIAALEAGIPDAGALIFAALGIALALHGRRACGPAR